MQFNATQELKPVTDILNTIMNGKPQNALMADAQRATQDMEFDVGLSNEPGGPSLSDPGISTPLYVADSLYGGNLYGSDEVKALIAAAMKQEAPVRDKMMSGLSIARKYNRQTGKFDMHWSKGGVMDSSPDLISAQLASPGSIGYFNDIFLKPLIWSNAKKHAEIWTGTNPWAEMMTQTLGDFSGFAGLLPAGAVSNNMSSDVEFQSGIMTQPVINASVTYRISIEEQERAKNANSQFPFVGQPITYKQQYANWALDMLDDYTIYYGIPQAGINGLFQVNGTTAYPGSTLTEIAADSGNTNKGQTMYQQLAAVVASFLSTSKNMLSRVRIAMSPEALNQFSIYNYSNVYNPETSIVTFVKSFLAGEGKSGTTPDIEIFSDPLLSANTLFNSAAYDYLVISAPQIVGGPNEQTQALIRHGMPLPRFMYPVIPGMQGTPYKTLMRTAGIFAPYTPAVAVYTGFGVD